jgi:hypothetical protein
MTDRFRCSRSFLDTKLFNVPKYSSESPRRRDRAVSSCVTSRSLLDSVYQSCTALYADEHYYSWRCSAHNYNLFEASSVVDSWRISLVYLDCIYSITDMCLGVILFNIFLHMFAFTESLTD